MKYKLTGKEIFLENECLENGAILIDGDTIAGLQKADSSKETIDLSHLRLLPGLIDIHVHGGNGFDVMDATKKAILGLSRYKLQEGVTAFCPTTVTSSMEKTIQAVEAVQDAMDSGASGAKILGAFLEGPYISPLYKGAHPEGYIRKPDDDEAAMLTGYPGVISILIAPELENSMGIIKKLTAKGINVRIGHSACNHETVYEAFKAGANIAVHAFNAMSPFTSRNPGMVGGVFTCGIYAEIICDCVHVHPVSIRALLQAKSRDEIILVTDCIRAGGCADGPYNLGELDVIVENGIARLATGPTLAGSTLRLIDAVRNMHETVGVPLPDAVRMASINPARALGIHQERGSIAIGKKADIIGIDDDYNICFAMVEGQIKIQP